MPIDWNAPEPWLPRKPLAITPDMPKCQRVARVLHNAQAAYDDAVFALEHALAAEHFDAIARGDDKAALEAERLRRNLGLLDDTLDISRHTP